MGAGHYLANDGELPQVPLEMWVGRYLAYDGELPQVHL